MFDDLNITAVKQFVGDWNIDVAAFTFAVFAAIYAFSKPKKDSEASGVHSKSHISNLFAGWFGGTVTTNINNSVHYGIKDDSLKKMIEPLLQDVKLLLEERSHASHLEEKIKLENQLTEVQNELEKKKHEVGNLQKTIDSIQPNEKILSKAKEILTTQGADETIAYLKSSEARAKKSMVDEQMMEQAKQFQFEAELLMTQNRYDEAKEAYEQMLRYDRSHDRLFEVARFLQGQNDFKDAKKYYTEALEIRIALAETNSNAYTPDVAMTLNNLAILESKENHHEKARGYFTKALEIQRDLAETNSNAYTPDVAMTLNNLAILESKENHHEKARDYFTKALETYRDLAKTNPSVYTPDVATTLNNLAILESKENHHEKARGYYTEALDKYRALAKTNQSVYTPYVAAILNNLALLENTENHHEKARDYCTEALEKYKTLAKTNPSVYSPDVAMTLKNLAVLEMAENHNDKARDYYTVALEKYKTLAKTNPSVYSPDVAGTLHSLAVLEMAENHNDKAKGYFTEALKIRRALAETNPDAFDIMYARTLIMGIDLFGADRSDLEEAKKILQKERYKALFEAQKLLWKVSQIEEQIDRDAISFYANDIERDKKSKILKAIEKTKDSDKNDFNDFEGTLNDGL